MLQSNNTPRAPWVCNSDLLDHLSLLNAFHQLRTIRPEPEFLHMALFRFELWIGRLEILSSIDSPAKLPPLDVLMVWHAYCLGSRWYFEDSRRMYPILKTVDFPLTLAATQYRRLRPKTKTLGVPIPDQAITNWFEMTNTIFDPVEYSENPSFRTTLCPICESAIETRFTNRAKEGWAESFKCKLKCDQCGWKGQKSDLALHKLIRDLISISSVPLPNLAKFDSLAGTLSTTKRLEDVGNAAQFNRLVSRLIKSSLKSDLTQENLRSLDQEAVLQIIKVLTTLPKISKSEGVARILSAYSVAEPFSLDLITYMKRQESFRNIIIHLGWNKAASSAAREDVEGASRKNFSGFAINRAASRYQADLAWRTHQLKGVRYSQDMFHYLGRTIDHFTDRIHDIHTLEALFESTSKAWEKRYNVMYSQYPVPDLTIEKPHPLLKAILQELSSHNASLPNKAEKTKEEAGVDNVLQSMSIESEQVVRFVIGESPPSAIVGIRAPVSRSATEQEQRSKFGLSGVICTNGNLQIDEGKSGQMVIPDLLSGNVPRVVDVSIPQEDECWGEKVMKDLISVVDPSLDSPNHLADLSVVSEPREILDVAKPKHELVGRIKFEDDVTLEQDGADVDQSNQKVSSHLGQQQQQGATDLSLDSQTGTVIIPNVIKSRPDTASTGVSELSCVSSSVFSESGDITSRPTIQITSIRTSPTVSIVDSSSAATVSVTEDQDTMSRIEPTPTNYITSLPTPSTRTNYHYCRARRLSDSTAVGSVQSDSGELTNSVSESRSRHDTDDHEVAVVEGGSSVSRTQSKRVQIDGTKLLKLDTPPQSARQLADAHKAPVTTELRANPPQKTNLPSISQLFGSSSIKPLHLRLRTESLEERQTGTREGFKRIRAKQQDGNFSDIDSLRPPGRPVRNNRQLSRSESMRTRGERRLTPRNTQAVTSESADSTAIDNQQPESLTPFKRPLPKSSSNVMQAPVDVPSHAKRDGLTKTFSEARQSSVSGSRQAQTYHHSRLPKRLLCPKDRPSDVQSAGPARPNSKIPMLKSKSMPVQSSQLATTPTVDSMLVKPSHGILKRGSSNPEKTFGELGGSSKESPTPNPLKREKSESIKALKVSWGQDVGLSGRGLRKPKYLKNYASKIEDQNQQPNDDDIIHADNDNDDDDLNENGSIFDRNLEGKLEMKKENEGMIEIKEKLEEIHPRIEPDDDEEKGKSNLISEELDLKTNLNLTNSKDSLAEDSIKKEKRNGNGKEKEEDYDDDSDGDHFHQLKVNIPIGKIGFVEGSKIRLLEPNHLM